MKKGWDIEKIDLTPPEAPKPDEVPKGRMQRLRVAVKKHWLKTLLIVVCLYVAFVIFGMLSTGYYIDDNGYRQPIEVTFSYLEDREDYQKLKEQYDNICSLMVDITIVDIHLSNEEYTDLEAVTYYQDLLNERVDVMIPKITALEVGEEQAVLQESLQTLLSNDVAIYLQKMVEGLRSGNRASIESALTWRDKAFSSFEALRGDMANFARRVKMDYQSIENWSLNGTVLEKDGTAQLKQEN